jgi:hypothetical protein
MAVAESQGTSYVRALFACRRRRKPRHPALIRTEQVVDVVVGESKKELSAGESEQMSSLPGGFLSVRVLRGINLVSCDAKGSDPYVVLSLDGQVRTSASDTTLHCLLAAPSLVCACFVIVVVVVRCRN